MFETGVSMCIHANYVYLRIFVMCVLDNDVYVMRHDFDRDNKCY